MVLHDDLVGINAAQDAVTALQTEFPGEVLRTYQHALNGYAVNMSQRQVLDLADSPMVAYVVENGIATINATQSGATWGLDRTDQRDLPLDSSYTYNTAGAGVHVYIVDTGIRTTHDEFTGRIGAGHDAVDNDSDPSDCNGHGTHVAGTIAGTSYGVAKQATLHGVRVLDCNGSGTWDQVIGGVDWVTSNAQFPAVANMSLGGGQNQALNDAVANAVGAGVFFAVAAGNESTDACTKSPASTPEATTVGSSTSTDARSSFSNYGSCVDIFAPGSSITSAWHTSNSATNTISGTSMASPHVAGGATLYLSANPGASPAEVDAALKAQASVNKISNPGTGSPNLLLYTAFIGGGGDVTPPTVDITSPASGATVSGTVSVTATAGDDTGVTGVEFFVDGASIGSDTSAPYSVSWDTTTTGDGAHTVEARAGDAAGNTGSDSAAVTVSNGGGGGSHMAIYDPALGTAACQNAGNRCDSGELFDGRGNLSGGAESNASNTLDGCADGSSGAYHNDESNDQIRVYTVGGEDFAAGSEVTVEARVWAWSTGSSDRADVFYTRDVTSPTWTHISTLAPSGGGEQTLTTRFTLESSGLQAVRVQWRYNSTAVACSSGGYNDRDDLVFQVGGSGGGGPVDRDALYDAALEAPACSGEAKSCNSQGLLDGRGNMSGGAESNAPNTIGGSCSDGNSGTYHSDESVDQIVVTSTGSSIASGTPITIDVTAYFWSTTADSVDVYYADNAASPVWQAVAVNQKPNASGSQTLTFSHTPSTSGRHAVRAQIRYNGSASSCTSGSWNDHDDLVFDVQ